MMKKLLRAAAAALAMTVCLISCEDTPKPEEEIIGDVEMVEYTAGEAKEIRIPLTYSEDPAPVEVKVFDIPEMGAKQPPCCTDTDDRLNSDEYYEQPVKGSIQNYTISGGYVYLYVDYDGYCHCHHETAIMSYNMYTAELKEIYVHSDAETGEYVMSLAAIGDKLYIAVSVTYLKSPDTNRRIYEIDTATGEKKTIYEDESYSLAELHEYDGKLYFYYSEYENNENGDEVITYILKSYDSETGEWTIENDSYFPNVDAIVANGRMPFNAYPFYFGEVLSISSYNTDSKLTKIIADKYFSIETKHKSIQLVGASENNVRWLSEVDYGSYVELYLNSFDRDTMEICNIKLDRQSVDVVSAGEGCVALSGAYSNNTSYVHYLLPELGLAFPITELGTYSNLRQENGVISFAEYTEAKYIEDGVNIWIANILDKIYVIDTNPVEE